jgi:hypothetical protein
VNYLLIGVVFFSCITSLAGCENNFSAMEGSELRSRAYQCVIKASSTAAEEQVCENIQRECLRRQDAGQFDC